VRTAPASPPAATSIGPTPAAPKDGTPIREGEDGTGYSKTVSVFDFTSDSEIVEATFDPNREDRLIFAVCPKDGQVFMAGSLVRDDKLLEPPEVSPAIAQGYVLFASEAADYGSEQDLDSDIREFINRYADVPPFWSELMTAYVKLTWCFERFNSIPYLRFMGEFQQGKTRMAQTVAYLCYRTIIGGGATTSAPFFRLMSQFRGSFFLDEADYRASDLWSDIIKILNGGYKKGLPVWRCNKDNEPEPFNCFGPKILTTRKRFEDPALESRCITLETHEGKIREDIARQLPEVFYKEALALRNKLLVWRFRNYRRIRFDQSEVDALDSRPAEIAVPLLAVSNDPGFHSRLINFFGTVADEQRAERPQSLIVEAVRHLAAGIALPATIFVGDVAKRANELWRAQEPEPGNVASAAGVIVIRTATGDDARRFTPKRAGQLIRSLGFETSRTNRGYQFRLEAGKLQEVVERYQTGKSGRVGVVPGAWPEVKVR
jgi:hypothetical protein